MTAYVHICEAVGCFKSTQPQQLMCYGHWKKVPRPLAEAVWAAWKSGGSIDHTKAKQAAIAAVAKEEGR